MSYKRIVQQDLPLHYLRFTDAGGGASAKNEGLISGFGNSGSYNASYGAVLAGNRGPSLVADSSDSCYRTTGSGQQVALAQLASFGGGWEFTGNGATGGDRFSLSMWVKTTSVVSGQLWKAYTSLSASGSRLVMNANGTLVMGIETSNTVITNSATTTTAVNDGNIHFIVVTHYRGVATEIWIDGVREVNTAINGWLSETSSVVGTSMYVAPSWIGDVDEFAFYGNLLTEQQIKRQNAEGRTPVAGASPGRFVTPGYEKFSVDKDGTLYGVYATNGTFGRTITQAEVQELIDDDDTQAFTFGTGTSNGWLLKYVFPEPRDIYAVIGHSYNDGALMYSTNATNLADGSWGQVTSNVLLYPPAPGTSAASAGAGVSVASSVAFPNIYAVEHWRILRYPLMGVRGIGMQLMNGHNSNVQQPHFSFQVYGKISDGQNPNRVVLWDPTVDRPLAGLDFGDVYRGASRAITFRLKNLSPFTANSVVLTTEALTQTLSGPTLQSQFAFSDPGTTTNYSTSKTVISLAPGAISGVVSYRVSLATDFAYGNYMPRILVTPGSFT